MVKKILYLLQKKHQRKRVDHTRADQTNQSQKPRRERCKKRKRRNRITTRPLHHHEPDETAAGKTKTTSQGAPTTTATTTTFDDFPPKTAASLCWRVNKREKKVSRSGRESAQNGRLFPIGKARKARELIWVT